MRLRIANCGLRISYRLILLGALASSTLGQIPAPGPAKSVNIPAVKESKLKNGLTVAVVEKRSVPIVTVQLLVKSGASSEEMAKAGLADMTATLLTKGTKTRTAEQIAEEMEFLGASISSTAGWNNSSVTITVTSDKIEQAIRIMADVVLNPSFTQKELDLLKTQKLDELKYNLTQPTFLASYVASAHSFKEHPAGGTPESISAITRGDIADFHSSNFAPWNAVLIFTGDITSGQANSIAAKAFAPWTNKRQIDSVVRGMTEGNTSSLLSTSTNAVPPVRRLLVVDMPQAGQASVNYVKRIASGRVECFRGPQQCDVAKTYFPASVLNSLLGGGYSSRLNQEIRIKRGLSYGAGSSISWRHSLESNFGARTQTKNESAAEVAELVLAEIKRLAESSIPDAELNPRKSVLTGGFGRTLETTAGLAGALGDLYVFDLATSELNSYTGNVTRVTDGQIKEFARQYLLGGDLIIVGDYSLFKDDLAKRFQNTPVDVVKAAELDITKPNLRK